MTTKTEGHAAGGPPQTFCDFCGRPTTDAGPMVEGKALVALGARPQDAHICAACVGACEGIFRQFER